MQTIADIFVLRGEERLGPYTPQAASNLIAKGILAGDDLCIRAGQKQTLLLGQLLEMGDSEFTAVPAPGFEVGREEYIPHTTPLDPPPRIPEETEVDTSRIVYVGHPSFLNFPWLVGLSLVLLIVGAILWSTNGFILLGGLVFTLFTYIFVSIHRAMRHYLISRKRVEIIYGLFIKSSNEVRISDVRTINVKATGLKGLLGVGNVEFASAGSGGMEVEFRGVHRPHHIKQLVRAIQDGKV